jgi:UrcA family protein
MTRELLAALALAATTALAAPAFAAPQTAPTVTLKISDLDLSTAAGMATAKQRIATTSRDACSAVMVGSRLPKVDQDCEADLTKRLTDRVTAQQQARKAGKSENAGLTTSPKAVDQAPAR